MARRPAEPLTEGMRAGDLKGLVLPLISIDEYVSKVDETSAVVVGFYVHDQSAAQDLNRFVQKSALTMLDTEISPAPDQHGFYIVFVEFLGNDRFAENVKALIEEVAPLADVEEWGMRVRGRDGVEPLDMDVIQSVVDRDAVTETALRTFFSTSDLSAYHLQEDRRLVFETAGSQMALTLLDFGPVDEMVAAHSLDTAPLDLDMETVARCRRLTTMLGEGWEVTSLGGRVVLRHDDLCAVLKSSRHTVDRH